MLVVDDLRERFAEGDNGMVEFCERRREIQIPPLAHRLTEIGEDLSSEQGHISIMYISILFIVPGIRNNRSHFTQDIDIQILDSLRERLELALVDHAPPRNEILYVVYWNHRPSCEQDAFVLMSL